MDVIRKVFVAQHLMREEGSPLGVEVQVLVPSPGDRSKENWARYYKACENKQKHQKRLANGLGTFISIKRERLFLLFVFYVFSSALLRRWKTRAASRAGSAS